MRLSRHQAVLATTAALLGACLATGPDSLAARSPGAAEAAYPRLAGMTTFTAERSARAVVDLPREVTIPTARGDGHLRGLTISGAGRVVGLSLVSPDGATGLVE